MTDDIELLRRYAEERSEDAFAELVQRQFGLVYAVALRKVGGDTHLAQDVAQTVFTDLARKSAKLTQRTSLTGWLFTSSHYAAAKVVRAAQRRRTREQQAELMHELNSNAAIAVDWERLRPVLDDLIGELGDRDREAVLVRFFEGRDFAEVGVKLNLSPDGARSRVERAVEKIRASLARRGVTSTATALGFALANQAGVAAPAGLTAAVTSAALAGAASGGTAGVLIFMSMNKLAIGITGALVIAGVAGLVQQQRTISQLRGEVRNSHPQEVATPRADRQRNTSAETDLASLRAQHEELIRLRGELRMLKYKSDELARSSTRTQAPLATGMLPVESWANAGNSTPKAAFQTELWASAGGDIDLAAKLITFDAASRARAQAMFTSLPANQREQLGTPERMAAFFMAGSPIPLAGMQVLGQSVQGPDDVTLNTQWQFADGRVRENNWQYHRDSAGNWQRIIPSLLVSNMGKMMATRPVPAAPGAGGK